VRAVIGVVGGFWVIDDPLRVVGSVVEDDVNDAQHAFLSLVLEDFLQLSDSLRRS
jgi:hypothetical protein